VTSYVLLRRLIVNNERGPLICTLARRISATYGDKYIRMFSRWQTTWVFITLTDDDVENILNH